MRVRLISCFLSVCECVLVRRWLQLVLFRICVICVLVGSAYGSPLSQAAGGYVRETRFRHLGASHVQPSTVSYPECRFRLSGGYKL